MKKITGLEKKVEIEMLAAVNVPDNNPVGLAHAIFEEGINNDEECESAILVMRELKAAAKSIASQLEPSVKLAHATHKSITRKRAELVAPYDSAEKKLRQMTNAHINKMAAIAKAEAERVRREQEDLALEAARKAEADAAEAAAALRKDGQSELADKIAKQGVELAVQTLDATTQTLDSTPVEKPIAPAGARTATKWFAEVVDMKAFLIGATESVYATQFVKVNEGELNRFAQKCKGDPSSLGMPEVPGVAFRAEERVSV